MAKGDAMGWFVGGCAVRRGVTVLAVAGVLATMSGSSGAQPPPKDDLGLLITPTFAATTQVPLTVDEPVFTGFVRVVDKTRKDRAPDAGSGSPLDAQGVGLQPRVERCGEAYRCYRYVLRLPEGAGAGARLRFAVDYREDYLNYDAHSPAYEVVLRAPDGEELARSARGWARREVEGALPEPLRPGAPVDEGVSYGHLEAFLDDPAHHTVEAVVIAERVLEPGMGFEGRALLQAPLVGDGCEEECPLLLPDLQPEPPYNLVTGARGCVATGLDDPVQNPEVPCTKRLRFAYGYSNAGDGPLHLEFSPLRDLQDSRADRLLQGEVLKGDVVQRVFRRPAQRDAYEQAVEYDVGPYHLHASHQHFHYGPMYSVTLHSYDAKRRKPVDELSDAPKVGNCGHDLFMADFSTTRQDPRGLRDSDGCTGLHGARPDHAVIGLSTGWGDIYPEGVGDSYVPLTRGDAGIGSWSGDGHYLLVQRVNLDGILRESDYGNNVGYTHFELFATDPLDGVEAYACIHERGIGESPSKRLRKLPLAWPAVGRHGACASLGKP